jgi:ankyrin repeat protein
MEDNTIDYFNLAFQNFNNERSEENFKILLSETLSRGQSLDLQFKNGYTLLHYAVRFNLENECKKLLQSGASVMLKTSNGKTPFDIAMENGNQIILQYISTSAEYYFHVFGYDDQSNNRLSDGSLSFPLQSDTKHLVEWDMKKNVKLYDDYIDWTDSQRSTHIEVHYYIDISM